MKAELCKKSFICPNNDKTINMNYMSYFLEISQDWQAQRYSLDELPNS